MLRSQPFMRDDTFLGVCHALGEDLRINPVFLRLVLCGLMFWQPAPVLIGYAIAGCLVALLRWIVPNPQLAPAAQEAEPVTATEPRPAAESEPEMPLAKAA